MRAPRILLPLFVAALLTAGCTGQFPTAAEPSFNTGRPTAPDEEQAIPSSAQPPANSDTIQTTERGIGTIGSNG
jgi:hypothetical protein